MGLPSAVTLPMLEHFPLPNPRPLQVSVLNAVQRAYEDGYRYVILEAPVGSGKSAMAICAARKYGTSHILTPKKNLQDQYFDDFSKHIALMKGRGAYPCVYKDASQYGKIIAEIKKGGTPSPAITGVSVADGACSTGSEKVYDECNARHRCPYAVALDRAIEEDHVVHNVHSFIFQAYMHSKFDKRGILIVDEVHTLEDICRDFMTREIKIPGKAGIDYTVPDFESIEEYRDFLLQESFMPRRSDTRKDYLIAVDALLATRMKGFVVEYVIDDFFNKTLLRFIPKSIRGVPESLIFSFGERVLLMSGTIYDKSAFCSSLGIAEEEACFMRVPSTFPVAGRPIIMKAAYMTGTSFAEWKTNIKQIADTVSDIIERFPNAKGLIHTPSYYLTEDLIKHLRSGISNRVKTHAKTNFRDCLESFYASEEPLVFFSPICQEGVDFKDDRARFQVILRIPYPSMESKIVKALASENYAWYNRKALQAFGQQTGRINRSESDHGVTILLDNRFPAFIKKNSTKLPKWFLDAVKVDGE